MHWTTPDFIEVNLSGEVTAYANTDTQVRAHDDEFARTEPVIVVRDKAQKTST